MKWRVSAPGWTVCWIELAPYIFGSNLPYNIGFSEDSMETFEDVVCFCVTMVSSPPAFDDSSVVPIDEKLPAIRVREDEHVDKELEAARFRPADIPFETSQVHPSRKESPGLPFAANDNANAHARAGIGESR
jgi:hypothetical protein